MESNDIEWMKKLKLFPPVLLLIANAIVLVVIIGKAYLYYDAYVAGFSNNLAEVNLEKMILIYQQALEKIVFEFVFWPLIFSVINFGVFIYMKRTRSLVIQLDGNQSR